MATKKTSTDKELKKIENILDDIRINTKPPLYKSILNGVLNGAGVVIGTVAAIVLLGWILSLFNVVPGFGEISRQLNTAFDETY